MVGCVCGLIGAVLRERRDKSLAGRGLVGEVLFFLPVECNWFSVFGWRAYEAEELDHLFVGKLNVSCDCVVRWMMKTCP